jgi:hypothetical protein
VIYSFCFSAPSFAAGLLLLEQHPPHCTHSLRLGSPDNSPAAKLGAEKQKL